MAGLKRILELENNLDDFGEIILTLENGDILVLNLEVGMDSATFKKIKGLACATDGDCIYWENGTVLTSEDMIAMIKAD